MIRFTICLFIYTLSFFLIILIGSDAWVLTSRFDYCHGIEVALQGIAYILKRKISYFNKMQKRKSGKQGGERKITIN
jgi:hypothetical protein